MVQFGDVEHFLTTVDVGAATSTHLLSELQDTQQCQMLRIELTVVIDAGHSFVKATYRKEGDGPIVLQAYEEIVIMRAANQSAHYTNKVSDCTRGCKFSAMLTDTCF